MPGFLAANAFIEEAHVFRGLAGAGLVLPGYGTIADLITGAANFLSPLFGAFSLEAALAEADLGRGCSVR